VDAHLPEYPFLEIVDALFAVGVPAFEVRRFIRSEKEIIATEQNMGNTKLVHFSV
jgi:hypothetical protein